MKLLLIIMAAWLASGIVSFAIFTLAEMCSRPGRRLLLSCFLGPVALFLAVCTAVYMAVDSLCCD